MITVGEVLKKQRIILNKTLEGSALETKIQLRFLQYIEDNNFEAFDSDVYAQGFIKIYSKYLNLNEERILAIYRRSLPPVKIKRGSTQRDPLKRIPILISPKLLTIILSVIFLLGILTYLGYQIYQFQSPPNISIQTPLNDSVVENEKIFVKGSVDKGTTVFVNDSSVEVDETLAFETEIILNPGINLITVVAKKSSNTQENVETLKVTYNVAQDTATDPELTEKPNIIKLSIVNSSVWVQLNIDKVNKLSQILQVGDSYEYEIVQDLSLTTGKIASTQVFFNDQELSIKVNSSNVGSLVCTIIDNDKIDCE